MPVTSARSSPWARRPPTAGSPRRTADPGTLAHRPANITPPTTASCWSTRPSSNRAAIPSRVSASATTSAARSWMPAAPMPAKARTPSALKSSSSHASVPSRPPMTKLEARHLAKAYKTRKVVQDVSLSINSGEVVGLLGPNGAGKTTCFYMIVGLVKADQGNILINGQDVTRLPMHGRARQGIGYLPQEASIVRKLSVADNIMAVLETRKDLNRKGREEIGRAACRGRGKGWGGRVLVEARTT